MITSVKLVSIPVKDQEKALEFYTEILGFEVVTNVPFAENGQRWIELLPPKAQTKVVLFTADGQQDRIGTFSNIVFKCDDIKKTFAELKEKGVTFLQEPKDESWGAYALFQDPDGNQFVLSSAD